MFRVGEDTGTLDQQLETAAIYFDRELDFKIKRFTNLFEPAVILFMGLVVGFVVYFGYGRYHSTLRPQNAPRGFPLAPDSTVNAPANRPARCMPTRKAASRRTRCPFRARSMHW